MIPILGRISTDMAATDWTQINSFVKMNVRQFAPDN